MHQAIVETREVAGGVVASCQWPCAGGYIHGEAFVPMGYHDSRYGSGIVEVGRFGSRIKKAAKAAARSKVLRGIARTAGRLAKATPYGQAASAALNVARQAARAARGEGRRASALGHRASPRSTTRRGARGRALSNLSDAQRMSVIRMVLQARGSSRMKLALIRQAVGQ